MKPILYIVLCLTIFACGGGSGESSSNIDENQNDQDNNQSEEIANEGNNENQSGALKGNFLHHVLVELYKEESNQLINYAVDLESSEVIRTVVDEGVSRIDFCRSQGNDSVYYNRLVQEGEYRYNTDDFVNKLTFDGSSEVESSLVVDVDIALRYCIVSNEANLIFGLPGGDTDTFEILNFSGEILRRIDTEDGEDPHDINAFNVYNGDQLVTIIDSQRSQFERGYLLKIENNNDCWIDLDRPHSINVSESNKAVVFGYDGLVVVDLNRLIERDWTDCPVEEILSLDEILSDSPYREYIQEINHFDDVLFQSSNWISLVLDDHYQIDIELNQESSLVESIIHRDEGKIYRRFYDSNYGLVVDGNKIDFIEYLDSSENIKVLIELDTISADTGEISEIKLVNERYFQN